MLEKVFSNAFVLGFIEAFQNMHNNNYLIRRAHMYAHAHVIAPFRTCAPGRDFFFGRGLTT